MGSFRNEEQDRNECNLVRLFCIGVQQLKTGKLVCLFNIDIGQLLIDLTVLSVLQ